MNYHGIIKKIQNSDLICKEKMPKPENIVENDVYVNVFQTIFGIVNFSVEIY